MRFLLTGLLLMGLILPICPAAADTRIQLSTINWEPYTGEKLAGHGFFSELITHAFARVGYSIEFKYYPWPRALLRAKRGETHGVMAAYMTQERLKYFSYPNAVWNVKEEFIALSTNNFEFTGQMNSLKRFTIGVLRGSAQADELRVAGIRTADIADQVQNVKKLLKKRVDAVLVPRSIFFYHLKRLYPEYNHAPVRIIHPAFKTYPMYVAFSKLKPGHEKRVEDFNRGLRIIKTDGTYDRILQFHQIKPDRTP